MKRKIETVAVYCGHEFGSDPAFKRAATTMGRLIAENKLRMVFGGGDVGLMGTVAGAALQNGAHIVGVSTHNVAARQEPMHKEIEVEVVTGVNERKQRMYDLSDAFIILPGGIGTLNELTDIMTMQQIGESNKPLFFLNTAKFWDEFGRLFVHMQDAGFIENTHEYNIHVGRTPAELMTKILNY